MLLGLIAPALVAAAPFHRDSLTVPDAAKFTVTRDDYPGLHNPNPRGWFLLRWNPATGRIERRSLPDLPEAAASLAAAEAGGWIYVAGGEYSPGLRTPQVFSLNVSFRENRALP